MSTTKLDKSIDCGTSACVQIKLNRSAWSDFLYKNIITIDGVLTLTPYNIRGYIDKLVKVRTPMCCENPYKPCATCDSQVLWTKDNSSPAHMNSHRRPTICHKLTALKMMTMRTAIVDMINYKPKPYKGVIVPTPDDFKPELYDWNMLTNAPKENNWIKDAWHILTMAMITDPSWAWSVHCNLAMPIMDTLNCSHIEANNAAAILMKHIFNYDVTQLEVFKDIIRRSVSESNSDRTKSLSDKFDPDYAKFGIRNKYDLVRGKLIPVVRRRLCLKQKVKEYFIEHAYYSNKNYPSILFMIGESLNNDSVLLKTIKAGNLGDMERTLIIPNDELNFDDFKLVLNPANEAIEETSATCDASDFLSDLTNRIKEHRSIGSEPCDKDCIVKGTEVNPIAAHREKVLNFFKHGMTYLKKHCSDVHYTYRDDMSSYKRFVFRCKSPDIRDGAFITFDLEDLDTNDWQHIDDATIEESNKLQPMESVVDPITSYIKQLNPETKESLLKLLEIRNFFKPQGVYKNKRYNDGSFYIYQERQPRFDNLSFKRKNQDHYGSWNLNINCIDIDDWVFLGIDEPIDPKVQLCQKVKAFFKPGRIYCNPKGSFAGCYFEFYEIKESQFDIIRCKRHFFNNNPSEENTIVIDYIKFEDWTDIGDVRSLMMPRANCTDPLPEFVENKDADQFFKPGHVYSHRICHSSLCFEGQEVLATGTILRFIEASMGRLVTHRIDKIDLDDWTDITDTSAAPPHKYSFPHYAIYVTDESRRVVPTTNELGPQLLFLCSRRGPVNTPFHGSRGKCLDKLSQDDSKNQSYEYNRKFLIPGHIYCKMGNRDVLRFERKIPSLQSKVILRFRRVPNNEVVEFTTDEFRRDVWEDITYKLYQ